MNDILVQYGVLGVCVVGMSCFIMYLIKEHKKERAEWVSSMEKLFEKYDVREKSTNETIKENSNILTGLKTLFEIKIKQG